MNAELRYKWTDGTVGQMPPPPVIEGYESLVTTAVQEAQQATAPHREPPALATNPPAAPLEYTSHLPPAPMCRWDGIQGRGSVVQYLIKDPYLGAHNGYQCCSRMRLGYQN